jgi:hypothetical protein
VKTRETAATMRTKSPEDKFCSFYYGIRAGRKSKRENNNQQQQCHMMALLDFDNVMQVCKRYVQIIISSQFSMMEISISTNQ